MVVYADILLCLDNISTTCLLISFAANYIRPPPISRKRTKPQLQDCSHPPSRMDNRINQQVNRLFSNHRLIKFCRPPEPLPDYWAVPDFHTHPIQSVLFSTLCIISMARPSLKHHWHSKISDDEWEKHRKTFVDRLSNTNIDMT
jgi:hypothetical protein